MECSNKGNCNAATKVCDCSLYIQSAAFQTPQSQQPVLPVGNACEQNGASVCATFVSGQWTVCSGNGQCVWNYTSNTASCVCSPGTGGAQCQQSLCAPFCNANEVCNTGNGQCQCTSFWSTPAGCRAGNRTCECSVSLCGQGTPTADGSACMCKAGWKKTLSGPGTGACNVVQCPLTIYTTQGVIACPPNGTATCADPSSISQSLAQGCCVDTCPSCTLNATSGARTCQCAALSGGAACYTQTAGICNPNCHGSDALVPNNPPNCDSTSSPGTLICHCDWIVLKRGQFRDLRCEIYTCNNRGSAMGALCDPTVSQCCDCSATAYSGPFCSTPACGVLGTPNANGTACICTPPYTGRLCNSNSCGATGTVVATGNSSKPYECNCAGTTLESNDRLSCRGLDCAGQDAQACSMCLHGKAILTSGHVACNCTGSHFTGADCSIAVCANGGQVNPANATQCQCLPPFTSDAFCTGAVCFNGGRLTSAQTCECDQEWTGVQCQLPSGVAAPPSTSSSSSSSSGTSEQASSSSSSATSNSNSVLTPGAIAGIVVGSAVLVVLIGSGIFVTRSSRALKTSEKLKWEALQGIGQPATDTGTAKVSARYSQDEVEIRSLLGTA